MTTTTLTRAGFCHPAQVGTLWRTTPACAAALTRLVAAELASAGTVLELGTGDGAVLAALLGHPALPPAARVVACEINPGLAAAARARVGDPRAEIVCSDARSVLRETPAGVILSTLPLACMLRADRQDLLALIGAALAPGGVYAQLQYTRRAEDDLRSWFWDVAGWRHRDGFPWRGFPWPVLYACRNPRDGWQSHAAAPWAAG